MIENHITVDDLSKYLKISKAKAYRLVKTEGFPKISLGKEIRIPVNGLDEWLKSNLGKEIHLASSI